MDISERSKHLILASILFLIFGAFLMLVSNITLEKINNMYIRQNTALIGTLSKEQGFNENKVIGIVTKGDNSGYEAGKEILNKYSYKEGLDINLSPIMKDSKTLLYKNIGLAWFGIFIVFLISIYLKDRKNLKISKDLIKRANKIVEGDFSSKENYRLKDGAFETLYESFSLMEDRIKKDIEDLKKERLNLKNIINDISHQLKTPLTALMTYNHILKDYETMPKEDIDNFMELSTGQLERMDWLTVTLLKYARLEGDVVQYRKEEISLLDTVFEAVAPLKIKAEEKNQIINIEYGDGDFIFYHDRKWLSEALSNIIKNGIEHTNEEGKIEISIKDSPIYLEVRIRDNGEGIPEDKIKKIFERFYKTSSSKKPSSIGIGLALSKSIIEKHNGDITVKSKVLEGTCFTIRFIK
ncbi:HAMP domain-containing sensor histidine kinase [uncultured Clostridium sp.]|uniref:sensor histidine kinase n=1 Tax=uncultured Clostridium sp. TaxID=59620 RepID=UPI002603C1C7|nr:HAMP domain-containing sensor histidine kinase [uncultured Clostridium sp.]